MARGKIIEELSWDWGGTACEDSSLAANLRVDRAWKDDAGPNFEIRDRRAVARDAGSLSSVHRNSRADADLSLGFLLRRVGGRDAGSNMWGDREWRHGSVLNLPFWHRPAVVGDCGSISWGDREWRDDGSPSDGEGAAHFVFPDCSDRDFDPTLGVDWLAGDLRPIPDSDIPRDPGLLAGDSVGGHAFDARDDSRRRDDIYLPDAAFQNIYFREFAV